MKKCSILVSILALVLASLACQSVTGGGGGSPAPELPPSGGEVTEAPIQPEAPSVETEFPLPDGASNVMKISGTLNFQVKMSLDDAMKFYVEAFTKSGYTERPILTVTSETTFSMVFDGHASGKAIVVQGVDLGDGNVNISIRLEDV